jgi:hypothetical protein
VPILTSEVKWGSDNPIEAAPVLSEEDKEILKKRMEVLDKELAVRKLAKYKIEVFMNGKERGHLRAYSGALSIWSSGTRLHGGGDDKMYFCPAEKFGFEKCFGVIGGNAQGYGHLVCPKCNRVWKGSQVYGEIMGRWTTQTWTTVVHRYFMLMECNADLYLKYMKYDLRSAATLEQMKQHKGDKLELVRHSRVKVIYPLKNIIKDTAAGSDLHKRIRAFLDA